jgi:hypothetical protein
MPKSFTKKSESVEFFLRSPTPKQVPHGIRFIDDDVQIDARYRHVRVPRGCPHFGKRTSAGQGMADERVPPVMGREHLQPRHP